jgi:predicted nucleotidyltransferase
VTRHHAHHYLGFAATQWGLLQREAPPRVKPLLYVYRVLLTGIHLVRTGEVVADLPTLLIDRPDLADVRELIEIKRSGHETEVLDARLVGPAAARYAALRAELEVARDRSSLPERPSVRAEVDQLVIAARLDHRLERTTV